jgi:ataxia telangiectasia mutated family protein
MQLEEKALTWLVDSWRVEEGQIVKGSGGGDSSRMPMHMIGDTLVLLESICGFSKRSDLVFRILLPECPIMKTMVNEGKTKVIRDFLLTGRLPRFRNSPEKDILPTEKYTRPAITSGNNIVPNDLVQPRGRERKISSFVLKAMETLLSEWDTIK